MGFGLEGEIRRRKAEPFPFVSKAIFDMIGRYSDFLGPIAMG